MGMYIPFMVLGLKCRSYAINNELATMMQEIATNMLTTLNKNKQQHLIDHLKWPR